MNYSYMFPVVKGIQANKEYYIAMVPLKMIPKLFPANDFEFVPPEYRAQRKLNTTRIPIMKKYILDNRNSYVFSALAASIDGKYIFKSENDNPEIGVLEVEMDARFLINDGQHRKAAILDALNEDETLGDETIPIVFFADQGLSHSQQIFTDLNKNAVKTSNSISELYDKRDPWAVVNREVVMSVEFINEYTDKERDILGINSVDFFTLNTFYKANKFALAGISDPSEGIPFLKKYWNLVAVNMPLWVEVDKKQISKMNLREKYIVTQSVVIQAFGMVANYFYTHPNISMEHRINKINKINWRRSSKIWYKRAIGERGNVLTGNRTIILINNEIKHVLGIRLSENEQEFEKKFNLLLKQ